MQVFPSRIRRALSLLLVLCAATGAGAARADWPARPIKLIVPYAAGSGPDVVLRPIADALGRELGQPVIVDNRGGGRRHRRHAGAGGGATGWLHDRLRQHRHAGDQQKHVCEAAL